MNLPRTAVLTLLGGIVAAVPTVLQVSGRLPIEPAIPFFLFLFYGFPLWLVCLIPSASFFVWSPQLFFGKAHVPARSLYALLALTILSIGWHAVSWSSLAPSWGTRLPVIFCALDLLAIAGVWALGAFAARVQRFAVTLAFNLAAVLSVFTVAFPYFGDVP